MSRSDVGSILSSRHFLAAGTTLVIGTTTGQNALQIKHFGGGTLEIGGLSQTPGTMYVMSQGEVWSANLQGQIYISSVSGGATCELHILRGITPS